MLIRNIKLTVKEITDTNVILTSELEQKISIARDFLEPLTVGDTVYLAADREPLKIAEQLAKDVLNEILHHDD